MSKVTGGSHIGSGNYSVTLEVDKSVTQSLLQKRKSELSKVEESISSLSSQLTDAQNETTIAYLGLQSAISNLQGSVDPELTKAVKDATEKYNLARAKEFHIQGTLNSAKADRIRLTKEIASLEDVEENDISTTAWAVELADNSEEGVPVYALSTDTQGVELFSGYGGDPTIITGQAHTPTHDGTFKISSNPTPWAAFWNMAVLPAMAKWQSNYKSAVISNINYEADLCTVTFTKKTFLGIPLNKQSSAHLVPISYMTCNAGAFKDGDTVVVAISGSGFSSYTVIGFVSNPKGCEQGKIIFNNTYDGSMGLDRPTVVSSRFVKTQFRKHRFKCGGSSKRYIVSDTAMQYQTATIFHQVTTGGITYYLTGTHLGCNLDENRRYDVTRYDWSPGSSCTNSISDEFGDGPYSDGEVVSIDLVVGKVSIPYLYRNYSRNHTVVTTEGGLPITNQIGNFSIKETALKQLDWVCLEKNWYSYEYTESTLTFSGNITTDTSASYSWTRYKVVKDTDSEEEVTVVDSGTGSYVIRDLAINLNTSFADPDEEVTTEIDETDDTVQSGLASPSHLVYYSLEQRPKSITYASQGECV